MNIGEEICGEWLRHIKQCEFIQYNLKTPGVQGEIDVIGLSMKDRTVYACEVAIHLVIALQYTKNNQPDNVNRLTAKFKKDVAYLSNAFPDYTRIFMLWSPIVRNQKVGSKHNQLRDIADIAQIMKSDCQVDIEMIVNRRFQEAIEALRKVAGDAAEEMVSSMMRYLQVEEHLQHHLLTTGMKKLITLPSPSPAA